MAIPLQTMGIARYERRGEQFFSAERTCSPPCVSSSQRRCNKDDEPDQSNASEAARRGAKFIKINNDVRRSLFFGDARKRNRDREKEGEIEKEGR